MTKELLAEEGLSVDDQGFEELMERARETSRAAARARLPRRRRRVHVQHEDVLRFAREAGFQTRFVGYETTEADTVLRAAERANGWLLAKLEESPFYPEGGGQVSDSGLVETPSGRARVVDVYRVGDDQALALEPVEGEIGAGETVACCRGARQRGSRRCATTPPPTCCTRRCASGSARTCARPGSYVGPDKLRFDFTHGERLSPERARRRSSDLVNGWIAANHPVRAIETTRDEAERARRHGAVRREVRRPGADGRDRGRLARAVRRHPCRHDGRDRPLPRDHRDLERVQRASHRGHHGARGARLFDERTQRLHEIAAR